MRTDIESYINTRTYLYMHIRKYIHTQNINTNTLIYTIMKM